VTLYLFSFVLVTLVSAHVNVGQQIPIFPGLCMCPGWIPILQPRGLITKSGSQEMTENEGGNP
jgi:hypothetical protein